MPSAYNPDAILSAAHTITSSIAGAKLSGIMGDAAHFEEGGYHVPRHWCGSGDYSVQYPQDKLGDAYAASALDISLPPATMIVVTKRLMAACRAGHPDLYALREFFGTVNGTKVTGWDRHNPQLAGDDSYTSSDTSHLWHVHLSGYRKWADDKEMWAGIARVFCGHPSPAPAPKPAPQPAVVTAAYVVRKGDTLWSIETKHGWRHGVLAELNPKINPDALAVGQKLRVPAPAKTKLYVIRKGDTLWALETAHHWRHGRLAALNPRLKVDSLAVGQTIRVPA